MAKIIRSDGTVLFLDSVEDLSVTEGASVALHPMESDTPASDHSELDVVNISFLAAITEAPTQYQDNRQISSQTQVGVDGPLLSVSRDVLADLTGPARAAAARDFFRSCVGTS